MTAPLLRMVDRLWPSGLRFQNVGAMGEFEVRAEIPGIDPTRDIRIWLSGGVLQIEVNRAPTRVDQVRSEFHYGLSAGAVTVPRHVDAGQLSARYHRGVLTIGDAAAVPGCLVPIESFRDVTLARTVRDLRT